MHEPFFVDSLKSAVLGGRPVDEVRFGGFLMRSNWQRQLLGAARSPPTSNIL
jgi:hypothetical protein